MSWRNRKQSHKGETLNIPKILNPVFCEFSQNWPEMSNKNNTNNNFSCSVFKLQNTCFTGQKKTSWQKCSRVKIFIFFYPWKKSQTKNHFIYCLLQDRIGFSTFFSFFRFIHFFLLSLLFG